MNIILNISNQPWKTLTPLDIKTLSLLAFIAGLRNLATGGMK